VSIAEQEGMAKYVAEILSRAPKLSDEQRQRLTAIMRGAADGAR